MRVLIKYIFYPLTVLFFYTTNAQPIDRKALVERHTIINKKFDSLSSLSVGNGRFAFTLKTGNWTLIVEAINPYKNYSQSVLVLEGGPTDVGLIKLSK